MIGPSVEETEAFIIHAHGNQTRRRSDVLYHTHPIAVSRLALQILLDLDPHASERDVQFVVKLALLHDVVEDTEVDMMMLAKMGYPVSLLNSLHLLTKFDDEFGKETHKENVQRIIDSGDLMATIVKIADTAHNSIVHEAELSWFHENNRDPVKDTKRYENSNKLLLESPVIQSFRNMSSE